MMTPEEFLRAEPPHRFAVEVENLFIGDRCVGPVRIPVTYDTEFNPIFHLGEFTLPSDQFFASQEATPTFDAGGLRADLLVVKHSFGSDTMVVDARATRGPVILGGTGNGHGFEAVLLSPPGFLKTPIVLTQENNVKFEILPPDTSEGAPCLISSNMQGNAEEVWRELRTLSSFLTFVKGSWCGIGNLVAKDEQEHVAFQLLGIGLNDLVKRQTNWFDIEIQKDLSRIYHAFCEAWANEITRRALLQGIEYYRASNVTRIHSLHMAIIAAHSALEAFVNYILEHRAGWSKALMTARDIAFSDKMRAAATFLHIEGDLFERSPELRKLSTTRNDKNAFEIISFIRNKLVHRDTKYSPTGRELHEVWLLAQWLVEVFIFGVIGYRGTIIDRRILSGWRGTTMELPFTS